MLSRMRLLTVNNISGGGNSNSFSNNILALHTCRITLDVRGTDFIGYSVLYERLSLS